MTFGGRRLLIEDNLWWRKILMRDTLWWKTTFYGRQPFMEDDLWWNIAFTERWYLIRHNSSFYDFLPKQTKPNLPNKDYTFGTKLTKPNQFTPMKPNLIYRAKPKNMHISYSGGQLPTMLIATISVIPVFSLFFFLLSRLLFSWKECSNQNLI